MAEHTEIRRCSECRVRFVPCPSAQEHQVVCGAACRRKRRCRLGRRRRASNVQDHRVDERERQRRSRAQRREPDRGPAMGEAHSVDAGAGELEPVGQEPGKVRRPVERSAGPARSDTAVCGPTREEAGAGSTDVLTGGILEPGGAPLDPAAVGVRRRKGGRPERDSSPSEAPASQAGFGGGCHELASAPNHSELLRELVNSWDRAHEVSRTSLLEQLEVILGTSSENLGKGGCL